MIDDKGVAYAVPAESLCLDSRFDIAIKYMYAKGRLTDTMTDWHRGAYRDHIQAFNAFTEFDAKGSVTKVGESAFLRPSTRSSTRSPSVDSIALNRFQ